MQRPVRIIAIVVTHNRLEQLQRTLTALLSQRDAVFDRIVIVDNCSTDGTAPWLAAQVPDHPSVVVETLPVNAGGAGGFAHGMRVARDRFDPDWIVVMDDDARPQPDALAQFLALWRDGSLAGVAGVAAAVRHPDGEICRMNRPTLNPFWHPRVFLGTVFGGGRAAFHLTDTAFSGSGLLPIDGASFVGLFLSRAGLDLAGYPDARLFLYADDAIYTMQLCRRGGRMVFAPMIAFEHDTTSLAPGGIVTPPWKVYYYHRNRLLLYRLAAGPAFWVLLPLWLWSWSRLERRYPPGDRPAFRRLIRRGFRDAVLADMTLDHPAVLRLAAGQADDA
jgi:GT2 family glycosyltransferase